MKTAKALLPKLLLSLVPLGLAWVPISASRVLAESSVVIAEGHPPTAIALPTNLVPAQSETTAQSKNSGQSDKSAAPTSAATPAETVQPSNTPAKSPANQPVQPADQPADKPATSSDKPSDRPADKPAGPTNQPSDKPADKPPESSTDKPSDQPADSKPDDKTTAGSARSPEEAARWEKLVQADQLYREGKHAEAEKLYRQVKAPFPDTAASETALIQPFSDPEQLSPAGQVYWREAQEGIKQKLETRIFVPLKLLVDQSPEFVPGHLALAQEYDAQGKSEEAVRVLEHASNLYPEQPDLLRAKITALAKTEHWIEASIAARQFALLHPDNPAAPEFTTLADENLKRYQKHLKSSLTGNLIGNIVTGALGYAVTGSLYGPLSAIQTTILLLRGESAVGERFAKQAQRQLEMVDDPEILDYVNEVGQKLVKVAGRSEFKYEFYVVLDDDLNAFALPGGKVFVNLGAIAKTNSEAELAGLLAHELSHAVLSHGFQLVTQSSLTANVFQFIPFGGLINDLVVLNYSRDMEQQADILGTRLLAASDYAADGMRNLMVTLDKEDKKHPTLDLLSTHPVTRERVKYLEQLIQQNGYNRYAYEGVEHHAQIQARAKKLLREKKEREDKIRDERKRNPGDEP